MKETVILDGKSLTRQELEAVVSGGAQVEIQEEALMRAQEARKTVLFLTDSQKQIYGMNTGLGANKDRRITQEEFEKFNRQILYSHSVAILPLADQAWVRAAMLCRLNSFLIGTAGVQTEMILLLKEFLNQEITPLVPARGSVGLADLGNMAFLGLAMIGEGEVEYQGQKLKAQEALKKAGLKKLTLGPKDGLPMVSSNMFSVGKAALLCGKIRDLIEMSETVYAMGLEAQSYNPVFIDQRTLKITSHRGHRESLAFVNQCLEGSSIYHNGNETLYGALSFKSTCGVMGSIRDGLHYLESVVDGYLNASEDCPAVLAEEREIVSTDFFIVTGLAAALEMMDILLCHMAGLTANRIMRMCKEEFSGLPRFLRPEPSVIGYGTMQKTVAAVYNEIRHLANPASMDYFPTANESEDYGCMTPYLLLKTEKMLENLYTLTAMEAMYAAQASECQEGLIRGKGTLYAYRKIRETTKRIQQDDQILGFEIEKVSSLIREKKIIADEGEHDKKGSI